MRLAWDSMIAGLPSDDHWAVWIDWYEARLAGRATSEAYDFAFVPPQQVWEKGPAAANAWIREHLPKAIATDENDLAQRPAAYSFRVVSDKFDVAPEDGKSIDAGTTQELYDETKANALDLKERLERAQVDEKVRAHVDTLIKHLGDSFADVRIGSLLRSLRGLESDLHAYSSEEARRELFPDALSLLSNVTANVRDVLSTLPKWREIEAESVLLQMPLDRMPEAEAEARQIVETIKASDAVTAPAQQAIDDSVSAYLTLASLPSEPNRMLICFSISRISRARAFSTFVPRGGRSRGPSSTEPLLLCANLAGWLAMAGRGFGAAFRKASSVALSRLEKQ